MITPRWQWQILRPKQFITLSFLGDISGHKKTSRRHSVSSVDGLRQENKNKLWWLERLICWFHGSSFKGFSIVFLPPDWLKLNHLKCRMKCGFQTFFSRHICSTVAETIGVTNYAASFGAKNVQKITFEAAEMILSPWNQQNRVNHFLNLHFPWLFPDLTENSLTSWYGFLVEAQIARLNLRNGTLLPQGVDLINL